MRVNMDIPHYSKTNHLAFSKEKQILDISDKKNFFHLEGKKVIMEEKVDAQAIGAFFNKELLHILFRGQYYCPEKNILLPKELHNCYKYFKNNEELFFDILLEDKIIYGEWMEYTHTVNYNKLPSYFLEYDIYSKEKNYFLSTEKRNQILRPYKEIQSVYVHAELNPFDFIQFKNIININKLSQYGDNLHHEGFYVKVEDDEKVLERFKWIEPKFFNDVVSSKHWRETTLKRNSLK
jgi:ATP-dependent RNA circularization protein (DNA/RNA ligase family)